MTNTIVTYTHNPAAYKKFANFTSLKQFNTSMEMWLADHKHCFGKKELQALKTLLRHSVKIIGIATIKFKSLVKVAKEKYNFDFNLRTAKRAVEKAKNLGMLNTLETRTGPKRLKGPSIYVWQVYKCKNVTTTSCNNHYATTPEKHDEIKAVEHSRSVYKKGDTLAKMSPHKASIIKTNIIKILNTYTYVDTNYISITKNFKIKGYKLLTNPVKNLNELESLNFYSRLKNTIYNSALNNKNDVQAISEMVYGKVHSYTQFPIWETHRETLLEHALIVVQRCLESHKKGKLKHIRSMRGYINHKLNDEINAYINLQLQKMLPKTDIKISKEIIELYGQAIDEQKNYRKELLELYYG